MGHLALVPLLYTLPATIDYILTSTKTPELGTTRPSPDSAARRAGSAGSSSRDLDLVVLASFAILHINSQVVFSLSCNVCGGGDLVTVKVANVQMGTK